MPQTKGLILSVCVRACVRICVVNFVVFVLLRIRPLNRIEIVKKVPPFHVEYNEKKIICG